MSISNSHCKISTVRLAFLITHSCSLIEFVEQLGNSYYFWFSACYLVIRIGCILHHGVPLFLDSLCSTWMYLCTCALLGCLFVFLYMYSSYTCECDRAL